VQIPGLNNRGITSIEQHEVSAVTNQSTWPIVVVPAAATVKPVVAGLTDIVTWLDKVRDNRKD
jgi:hypothetical protein